MVLCIPGITSSSLRRQTLGQVAAEVSPSRDSYPVRVQNRMCGSTPHTQKPFIFTCTYAYPTVCNMPNVVSLCIEHTSKVGIYACKRVLYIVLDVKLCTRHIDSLKHLTQYSNPYVYESNKYDSEYRQYVLNDESRRIPMANNVNKSQNVYRHMDLSNLKDEFRCQNKYYISETKYKDMRSQPRLKEKQGKEVRTSKIIAEKHRYPRLDTVIQLHSERDTETGWDTRHLPALSREAERNCYGRKTNNQR